MTEHLTRFLGNGPYPFPLDRSRNMVDFFYSDTVALIVSKTTLDLPALTHSHDSYEFVLPLSVMPKSQIENKVVSFRPERLYPLNSEQSHGAAVQMPERKLLALQVDKHFLWHISYSMYRKTKVDFQNDGFALSAHARYLLWLFITESRNRQAGYKFILESLSTQMIVDILRRARSNMPSTAIVRNYSEKKSVRNAIDFLMEHYNRNYSLIDVAQAANLSPYHFLRTFKSQTGKTPYAFLQNVKVQKAQEMLKATDLSITEICYECGFNNPKHFSAVFKAKLGVTPSRYRRMFFLL